MGCRPAQKTSSGSAQFCALLREKLLLPVSDESADEGDVRCSNGAAMLKQPLSLIFHAELAVRLEYGARLQARPRQEKVRRAIPASQKRD